MWPLWCGNREKRLWKEWMAAVEKTGFPVEE
jgi:hypothetical protein